MGGRLAIICIGAAALAFMAASVRADTVVLKNKSIFTGTIVKQDEKQVTIRTDFGQITFKRDQVRSVAKSSKVKPYKPTTEARATKEVRKRSRASARTSRRGKARGARISASTRSKIGSVKARIRAAQKAQLMAKIRSAMKNGATIREALKKAGARKPG